MSRHRRDWATPNRVAAAIMVGLFVLIVVMLALVPYLLGESG